MNWFRIIMPAAVLLVMVYPPLRLLNWLGLPEARHIAAWLGLWVLCIVLFRLAFRGENGPLRVLIVHWLGAGFIFLLPVLLFELLILFTPVDQKTGALILTALGICIVIYAISISSILRVRKVEVESPKLNRHLTIAQLSDVHIGSRSMTFLHRIVERVNGLSPDLVVITGDLVDTDSVDRHMLSPLAELTAPCLFVTGNHERYINLERIVEDLRSHGITVLRNDVVSIMGCEFIGIDDAEDVGQVGRVLPTLPACEDAFRILLYHKPAGWEDAISHRVDLKLSGHTHNGQIFPFNYLVRRQFRYICGHYRRGDHHLYVSPGTGTWGPQMRLGTRNEITQIILRPV